MRLPPPFPDELLLGRLIRHVTASGESAGALAQRLFGSARTSIHPFLTAGLTRLAESSREDAEVLLNRQTLVPLFLFYLPSHAERLQALVLGDDGAKALRESQIPSFGSGHSVCLKWCPQCAQHDLQEYGVTYWHRTHQIPGVTACYKHPVLLQRVELEGRQRVIAGLLPTCNGYPRPASGIESRVAVFSQNLLTNLGEGRLQIDLGTIYRYRLNELGYITSGGRVRRQSLLRRFALEVEQYRPCPDAPLLRSQDDYRYISELLEPGGSHHPFRHLLFETWLFHEADKMLGYRPSQAKPVLAESRTGESHGLEQRCLKLLKEGRSMAEVYRLTGKSRCYLKRLATQHGVPLNLKPRALTSELQQRIIRMAKSGMHREAISKRCGIGIGSVEQVISSEPGLVAWRKRCHWESKRRRCRARITRYRQRHPDVIRKVIKEECNAEFFWLYGNDREWLQQALPPPKAAVGRARPL
ncbi:TnsD family Tn7-like transposition protein [Ferrimonas balearica]|uniref:TnsD family Tn7-like transposition protein n=1 Tax=Ferrimonas balearica TaxID=44012 RepID=UPI001C5AD41D|nr:TnsD family Tn7-like transposition protein [Ferrimonas balearica]MBW3166483.1 TnsD family transposase [Ferrimonas balearica]